MYSHIANLTTQLVSVMFVSKNFCELAQQLNGWGYSIMWGIWYRGLSNLLNKVFSHKTKIIKLYESINI